MRYPAVLYDTERWSPNRKEELRAAAGFRPNPRFPAKSAGDSAPVERAVWHPAAMGSLRPCQGSIGFGARCPLSAHGGRGARIS